MTDVYRAEGLALRTGRIWELRVPERPRYIDDLVAVPVGGGVHLLGGDGLTLGGTSAYWVLEQLVPLLDGTRDVAELRAACPDVSATSLLDVLHLMALHGLLEEGAPAIPADPRTTFFSRYLRVTGHCRNGDEARQNLARASVTVTGDPEWAHLLTRRFADSGVPGSDGPEPDLVVVIGDADRQRAAARRWLPRGVQMLCLDPVALTLGPLVYPRVSACPGCVAAQITAEPPDELAPAIGRLWSTALVSRAAQLVIGHLTGLFKPAAVNRVETWHPRLGTTTQHDVVRLPACALCGDPGQDGLALLYHRNVAIQPWHLRQPAGMQHHLSAGVERLNRSAFLTHPWAERTALPDPTKESADQGTTDLAALSFLLHHSVGGSSTPTDGGHHLRRHTASGGNLGSAEVYVVARRVGGLAPGLYHYVLVGHALERLRSGDGPFIEDDDGLAPLATAAAVLVVVSAVQRLGSKYADRGYYYCLLDAGLVVHRLEALAAERGLPTRMSWQFDDESLAETLGVDGLGLAPTTLVALDPA